MATTQIHITGSIAGRPVDVNVAAFTVSGSYFHQGSPLFDLLSCPDPALASARFQTLGGTGVWYASSRERGAWAELFRHAGPDVSPFEITRRVGRVSVRNLQVLNLADPTVCASLGIRGSDLVANDYRVCQDIAQLAHASGLDGILAPSAALPGEMTLALFAPLPDADVVAEHSRLQRPPIHLRHHLQNVRPPAGRIEETGTRFREWVAQRLRNLSH